MYPAIDPGMSRLALEGPSNRSLKMNAVSWARTLAFFSLVVGAAVTKGGKAKGAGDPLVDRVRAANGRLKEISAATAEGYVASGCASSLDGGAMGVRYVNAAYLKDGGVD